MKQKAINIKLDQNIVYALLKRNNLAKGNVFVNVIFANGILINYYRKVIQMAVLNIFISVLYKIPTKVD